jgi:tetratricopeptide (TPR) repeat protein
MSQALKDLIGSNDWPAAISECTDLISNEDNESVKFNLFVTLAKCCSEDGQYAASISAYRDAAKLNNDIQDPKYYKQFAEVLEKNKEYGACIASLWSLYGIVTSKKNFVKSLEVIESIRDKIHTYKKDLKVDFLREICSDFYFYLTGKAQPVHNKNMTVSTPGLVDLITSVHIMNMLSTLIDIQILYAEKKKKSNVKGLSKVSAEDRQAALDEELNPNHVCPMVIEHAVKVLHAKSGDDDMSSNCTVTENMIKLLYQHVSRKRSELFLKKTLESDSHLVQFMAEAMKVLSLDVKFYRYTHSDDKVDILPVSGYVLEAWISLFLRGNETADHEVIQPVLDRLRSHHSTDKDEAEIPECVYMAMYAVAAIVNMQAGCLTNAQQDIVAMNGCQAASNKQVAEAKKTVKITTTTTTEITPSVYRTLVQLVCLLSHIFTHSIEQNINESLSYSANLIKQTQLDKLGQNWYQVCLLMRVIAIGSTGQVKGATKHYAAFLASLPIVESPDSGGVARLVASLEQHPVHSKLIYLRLFFSAVRVLQYHSIAAPFATAVLAAAIIEDEGCLMRLSLEAAYGQAMISLAQCLSSVIIDLNEAKVSTFQIMDEMLYSLDVSSLSLENSDVVNDVKSTIAASITRITDLLTTAKPSVDTTIVDMLPEVYLRLAHLQWISGGASRDKKGALASALACAKLKSDMPGAMTLVGHVYLQVLADAGKATKCYLKALSTNALDKEAGVLLSRIYIQAEQPDKALKLWGDVLTLTPHAAWAYDIRARYYLSVGNYESAVVDFQHLLEADADRVITWYLIGVCYSKLMQLQSAYRAFHTCLTYCGTYDSNSNPKDGNDMRRVEHTCIVQELALVCSRLGNLSEAYVHYSTALAAYANPSTSLATLSLSGHIYTLKNVADLSLIRGYLYNSWGWSEEVGRSVIEGMQYLQEALDLQKMYPAASDEVACGKREMALYKLMGDLCCLARYCSSEELVSGLDALTIDGIDQEYPHLSYFHKAQQCYQLVLDRISQMASPTTYNQEKTKAHYDVALSYYLEASELMTLSGQGNGFYRDRLLHRDAKIANLRSKAAQGFQMALEYDNLHSDSWVGLALTHTKTSTGNESKISPTELCLLQSIAIDKNSAAYINLGVLYMKTGQADRAMAAFNQSQVPTQANYNPSDTWVGIGHLYERANQLDVAGDAYEVALEVDRPAQALLGKIMTILKRLQGQSPDGTLPAALGCWLADTTATVPYFSPPVSMLDSTDSETVPDTSNDVSLPASLLDMKRCLCRYVRIHASQIHAWLLLAWVTEQLDDQEEAFKALCTAMKLVHKYSKLYSSYLSEVESKEDSPHPISKERLVTMATHCCTSIFRLVANLVLREVYTVTDIDIKAVMKKRLNEMLYAYISESEMETYMAESLLCQVSNITDLASLVQVATSTTTYSPSTEYLTMLTTVINTGSAQALTEYITASNEALLQNNNQDTAKGVLNALCLYRKLVVYSAKQLPSSHTRGSLQVDMHSYLWSCMDFGEEHPLFALLCQPSHLTYLYWTLTTMMPLEGSVDKGHNLSLVVPLLQKALKVWPLCATLWLYLGHCGGGRAPVLADALTAYASDRLKVDMTPRASESYDDVDTKQRDYTSHQCAAAAISLLRSMEHIIASTTLGLQSSNALIGLNRRLMADSSAVEAQAYRCLAETMSADNEEAKQRFMLLAARLHPNDTKI